MNPLIVENTRKILIRILIITSMMIFFNFIYEKYFQENDIQEHSSIINLVRQVQDSSKIIYLGESSNFTSHPGDTNKQSISQMIADYFPGISLGTINKGALHSQNYLVLLENLPVNSPVKTIIVTMNLRSFGADWIYSDLETYLQKSMVLLKYNPPLFARFILSFKAYEIKTNKERDKQKRHKWDVEELIFPYPFPYKNVNKWDKGMFDKGIQKEDGSKDWEQTALACHYIKSYAFQIDTNSNPRIKDFDNIMKLAKKRGWNVIFNLMAENMEKARELIGNDLLYLMNSNRDILVDRYTKMGAIVVDNLYDVPNEEFIDQDWTTEHYAQHGRKIIAKNVADSLKKIMNDQ
ncbi:MAG: hypothetical protein ACOCWG_01425 [bacterium]